MKTIKGDSMNKRCDNFTCTINGKEYWVQGELYYNEKKQRFEHEHLGVRGGRYLIVWHKEF